MIDWVMTHDSWLISTSTSTSAIRFRNNQKSNQYVVSPETRPDCLQTPDSDLMCRSHWPWISKGVRSGHAFETLLGHEGKFSSQRTAAAFWWLCMRHETSFNVEWKSLKFRFIFIVELYRGLLWYILKYEWESQLRTVPGLSPGDGDVFLLSSEWFSSSK